MSPSRTAAILLGVAGFTMAASTAMAQGQNHCGQVNNNETWTRQASPHNVTCDVFVRNSVLTIESGALILMHADTNLVVEQGGSMQAVGNNAGRIRFRAIRDDAPPGSWGQLRFLGGAAPSALEFVDVNDGGAGGVPMVNVLDTVVVMGTQPTAASEAKNVRLYNAAGVPLSITANEVGPSLAGAGDYSQGRGCLQLAIEESNTIRAIEVQAADEPDVRDTQTWFSFCVPYYLEDELTVAGPDAPTLELNAGVELRFAQGGGIRVGMDVENPGQMEANGTADERVVIAGQTAGPGAWRTVDLTDFTAGGHSFSHTDLSGGGAGGAPMMRVTTSEAVGGGLRFSGAEAYPLEIIADAVQGLLEEAWIAGENAFGENGVNRIRVLAQGDSDIPRGTTWGDPGAPFEIVGTLTVGRNGDTARFRLLPDAELHFQSGEGLEIGSATAGFGEFLTNGVPGRPVVLTGLAQTPGSWAGVTISERADRVSLAGTQVSFGGSVDEPMIRWGDAEGSITSTVLSDAPGYPLEVGYEHAGVLLDDHPASPSTACSVSDRCANALERNGTNHFLVGGASDGSSGSTDWYDPGAPVEFAGSIVMTGAAVRLNIHDGLRLRFRAGEGMTLGDGVRSQATLALVDADPERRSELGPAVPATGWNGARVLEGSEVTGAGGAFDGAAAGSASLDLAGGRADLRDVSFRGALGTGARVSGEGSLSLTRGHVEENTVGVRAVDGGRVSLFESTVAGNREYGVLNEHQLFCIDAVRVFWGRPAGPDDSSDAPDGCMAAGNISPGADKVSDFVDWWPYAVNGSDYAPAPGLGPNPKTVFVPLVAKGWTD